jgi:ethanolamine utilization protein EutA
MENILLTVGIDLGTTTTQVIFSSLEIKNTASATSIPRIQIVSQKVVYRGGIYLTPLLSRTVIDAQAVRELVEAEYAKAGKKPADLSAGAVIITGETARKENSQAVLRTLSGLAGDFVVATAGSDLESILAGRGSGLAKISKNSPGQALCNMDIGGGTSNTAVFVDGEPVDSSCLDIGGRQIIVDPKSLKLIYVAEKVGILAQRMNLNLLEGKTTSLSDLKKITDRLAFILAMSLGLPKNFSQEAADDLNLFITAHPLKKNWNLKGLCFSGGVADFIYHDQIEGDFFPYGDLGALLGETIRSSAYFKDVPLLTPAETIRATVVGAGSNSLEISGSTVAISHPDILPLKNIPILKLSKDDEDQNFLYLSSRLSEKISWFKDESGHYQLAAISLTGLFNPDFKGVLELKDKILAGLSDYLREIDTLIIILERDMAKSLGNALINELKDKKVIALDTVKVENGDYIDLGTPLSNGRVVPVVVKTLIFGK